MLAHFVNSGHDDQTLREVHNRIPAPEFLEWAKEKKIFRQEPDGSVCRGENWGNPRLFCPSDTEFQRLRECVPSVPGFESAGPRPVNAVQRALLLDQSVGREAVHSSLDEERLQGIDYRMLQTRAPDRLAHLKNPELGARLADQSRNGLQPENRDVQIVITDGLSAEAVHHNIHDLLPVLEDGLKSRDHTVGRHILAHFGRVKLAEEIGEILRAKLVIVLVGERPGGNALASRSLSVYLACHLMDPEALKKAAIYSGTEEIRFEYTVFTNIYAGGLPAVEAGSVVAEKALAILEHRAAGNRLEDLLEA